MIENLIKEHTAAVKALTAAIVALAASLKDSAAPAASPCPPAAYGPASAAVEAAAVAAADALSGTNASCAVVDVLPPTASAPAEAPAPAVVPAPAEASAPVSAPVNQPAPVVAPAAPMSFEQLRGLCIRAGQAGLTADVLAFLRGLGYSMLADLPQGKYADLVQFLAAKGVK